MTKKMGAPIKYKPEYCEALVNHMASGLSYESFAALINTCRATLYNWEKEYPDFLDSKKVGLEKSLLFFETVSIKGMMGKIKGFNQGVWYAHMRNKHGWHDKQEITHNVKTIEDIIEEHDKRSQSQEA